MGVEARQGGRRGAAAVVMDRDVGAKRKSHGKSFHTEVPRNLGKHGGKKKHNKAKKKNKKKGKKKKKNKSRSRSRTRSSSTSRGRRKGGGKKDRRPAVNNINVTVNTRSAPQHINHNDLAVTNSFSSLSYVDSDDDAAIRKRAAKALAARKAREAARRRGRRR